MQQGYPRSTGPSSGSTRQRADHVTRCSTDPPSAYRGAGRCRSPGGRRVGCCRPGRCRRRVTAAGPARGRQRHGGWEQPVRRRLPALAIAPLGRVRQGVDARGRGEPHPDGASPPARGATLRRRSRPWFPADGRRENVVLARVGISASRPVSVNYQAAGATPLTTSRRISAGTPPGSIRSASDRAGVGRAGDPADTTAASPRPAAARGRAWARIPAHRARQEPHRAGTRAAQELRQGHLRPARRHSPGRSQRGRGLQRLAPRRSSRHPAQGRQPGRHRGNQPQTGRAKSWKTRATARRHLPVRQDNAPGHGASRGQSRHRKGERLCI